MEVEQLTTLACSLSAATSTWNSGDRLRLQWRREHVVVHSRRVICVTFDELLEDMAFRLESYRLATQYERRGSRSKRDRKGET